jgi:hypothetical protein
MTCMPYKMVISNICIQMLAHTGNKIAEKNTHTKFKHRMKHTLKKTCFPIQSILDLLSME